MRRAAGTRGVRTPPRRRGQRRRGRDREVLEEVVELAARLAGFARGASASSVAACFWRSRQHGVGERLELLAPSRSRW